MYLFLELVPLVYLRVQELMPEGLIGDPRVPAGLIFSFQSVGTLKVGQREHRPFRVAS